ncbi:MAG: CoB--CoM heterodisulfide reductase iron-sulfur subunit A family protein [Bacillota bacterium]
MSSQNVGAVLVVGAGIAGIQASLDLAEAGYYVYLVEKAPAIGGTMPMLDKTFPTNDCSMCILSPKLVECGRHLNIEILTGSELLDLQGEPGNFKAIVKRHARCVDIDKCTGCGSCAEECPQDVDDEFNQKLSQRKAIYKLYAQAYPNAYAIDKENCLECGACEEACQAGAIDHGMEDEVLELSVGAVILCPGFTKFDAAELDYYGYGKYPNVITSLEFERILSASGPFGGHLIRPSDHRELEKIAWIQCVGSRNVRNELGYCSAVCCMYAIKEAVIAKEHSPGKLETAIFYMDMRTYGKDFEKYYVRAEREHGVKFIRSRIYAVEEAADGSCDLLVRYACEDGSLRTDRFNLVVLSIGLQAPADFSEQAQKLGLIVNEYNFCEPLPLTGVKTARGGVYVAGAFRGPCDIPETVMQASAAAGDAEVALAGARGTLVKTKTYPPERNVLGEPTRIGVFVCHCGINIGSVVNVPEVVEYAKTLPNVVFAMENLYSCSQDAQNIIREAILENNLNRVVVASCTPRTHEPLFQETLREAGLNAHLFEMANIRDQCSWVHMNEPAKATAKAKDLVKMAVAKAAFLEPVQQSTLGMTNSALVIGGGVAGMTCALELAEQGYQVHLVEKESRLGGLANRIKVGFKGEDVPGYLAGLIEKVEKHPLIKVHPGCTVEDVSGFVGNFVTTLSSGEEIQHGAAVIATGAEEYRPAGYLYGRDERVLSFLELGEALAAGDPRVSGAKSVVLIQCVGSREEGRMYCSRICCTKAIKTALQLKEMNPEMGVYILYRDMRTYSFYEEYYQQAREKGVVFVRYEPAGKPVVEAAEDCLNVTVTDHILGVPLRIRADLVGLATAILPAAANSKLSQLFKVPLNEDGFFLEAHMKLRPVDSSNDGVFICGLAHGPKNLEENICQAKAAAARAATVLARDVVVVEGKCAYVNRRKCTACGLCEAVCPAKAVAVDPAEKVARVNEALCKGCGACASSCRCGAINVKGFTDDQIMAMVKAL